MDTDQPSFFDDTPIFILARSSLQIIDANKEAAIFYGYSRDELCKMDIRDLGHKEKRIDLLNADTRTQEVNESIWVHKKKTGETVYIQFTSHMFNYNGQPRKLAVAHDVTKQIKNGDDNLPEVQFYTGAKPLAEIVWDPDKVVLKWSDKAEILFGWTREDAVGKDGFAEEFIYQDEQQKDHQLVAENAEDHKTYYTTQGRVITKNGEIRTCEWYNRLDYDEEGNLVTIYSLVRDISAQKESEYLFRALSEKSLVGVYLIQEGVFKYVNPRFAEIFNYSKNEIENKIGPLDLPHPDDRGKVDKNIEKRMTGESQSIKYEFRCLTKDQKIIHVKVFGTRTDYMGKPAVLGTLLDITNSKLAYERYQASVENFEDLFDSISDAIYIQNGDRTFIKVNEAAAELTGHQKDFLIGETPDVITAPGKVNLESIKGYFKNALEGSPQEFEQWGVRKNGERFPQEVVLKPGMYSGERVVIAITRDVSERYEIEDKIKKSEEKFRQLFENAPFGIVMMDKHQEIRAINASFQNIFGYTLKEIEGLDIDDIIVPDDSKQGAHEISEEVFKGDTISASAVRKRKDDSLVDVQIYGVPVTVNEKAIAIFGIYADVTEQKEAESKIKKSLKEKEVLLAEIHHRVKNNLAVITGLLELQQFKTESSEAKDILRESQLRINSIALIHEKLYQNENLSQIAINVYLEELIEVIVASMATEATNVVINIESKPIFLTINQAIPCGLILNELITNAYKHAFVGRQEGEINIHLQEKGYDLKLVFKDNGVGIPADFDFENPSTLGLTLIQTLAKQLDGNCSFEREEEGTTFKLQFEVAEL